MARLGKVPLPGTTTKLPEEGGWKERRKAKKTRNMHLGGRQGRTFYSLGICSQEHRPNERTCGEGESDLTREGEECFNDCLLGREVKQGLTRSLIAHRLLNRYKNGEVGGGRGEFGGEGEVLGA